MAPLRFALRAEGAQFSRKRASGLGAPSKAAGAGAGRRRGGAGGAAALLALADGRERRRLGEAASRVGGVDVCAQVGVMAGEALGGHEEDVSGVGGGADQGVGVGAGARGDQAEGAVVPLIDVLAGVDDGAEVAVIGDRATRLAVYVLREQRVGGGEEDPLAVVGDRRLRRGRGDGVDWGRNRAAARVEGDAGSKLLTCPAEGAPGAWQETQSQPTCLVPAVEVDVCVAVGGGVVGELRLDQQVSAVGGDADVGAVGVWVESERMSSRIVRAHRSGSAER